MRNAADGGLTPRSVTLGDYSIPTGSVPERGARAAPPWPGSMRRRRIGAGV